MTVILQRTVMCTEEVVQPLTDKVIIVGVKTKGRIKVFAIEPYMVWSYHKETTPHGCLKERCLYSRILKL